MSPQRSHPPASYGCAPFEALVFCPRRRMMQSPCPNLCVSTNPSPVDEWLHAAVPRVLGPRVAAGRRCGGHARRHLRPECAAHVSSDGPPAYHSAAVGIQRRAQLCQRAGACVKGARRGYGQQPLRKPAEAERGLARLDHRAEANPAEDYDDVLSTGSESFDRVTIARSWRPSKGGRTAPACRVGATIDSAHALHADGAGRLPAS